MEVNVATETTRLARVLEETIKRECKRERGKLIFPDKDTEDAIFSLLKTLRNVNIYVSGHEIQVKPAAHVC